MLNILHVDFSLVYLGQCMPFHIYDDLFPFSEIKSASFSRMSLNEISCFSAS